MNMHIMLSCILHTHQRGTEPSNAIVNQHYETELTVMKLCLIQLYINKCERHLSRTQTFNVVTVNQMRIVVLRFYYILIFNSWLL